jgi:hypothetical protein
MWEGSNFDAPRIGMLGNGSAPSQSITSTTYRRRGRSLADLGLIVILHLTGRWTIRRLSLGLASGV